MRLSGQIVNLVRSGVLNNADQTSGIGHVCIVQIERNSFLVWIEIKVIDTSGVE